MGSSSSAGPPRPGIGDPPPTDLPRLNPFPVLETTAEGEVLYTNQAADLAFPELTTAGPDHPVLQGLTVMSETLLSGSAEIAADLIEVGDKAYERRMTYLPETGHIYVYLLDVTDREAALGALERSEARYRDLYENAPLAYFSVSPEGTILRVNEEACRLLGYERDELVDEPVFQLYEDGPLGVEKAREVFERHQHGQEVRDTELKMVHKDGTTVWVSLTVRGLRDEEGQLLERRSQVIDITDRKEAEARVEALLEAAPDGIVLVDASGIIQRINQQTEALFGYDRQELVGQPVEVLVPSHLREDHIGHRRAFMEAPERRPMGVGLDLEAVRKDGSTFPVEISLSPLETAEGPRVIAAVRDMSDRERERERLKEYAARLRESNEALEQFAYVISHDLREPIRMVSSYLSLLESRYKDELDEDANDFIEFAVDGAERMQAMIQALLRYSRVDRKGQPPEEVDVGEVIEGVLESLQLQIDETGATVTHDALPTVFADRAQLGQLMQNLVSNAVKFTAPERRPEVHISAEQADGRWRISVSDNGPGIPEDQQERIFQIFQRHHGPNEVEGQGMGLAICKKIVERHGGEIWVDSQEGQGATFHFTVSAPSAAQDDGKDLHTAEP